MINPRKGCFIGINRISCRKKPKMLLKIFPTTGCRMRKSGFDRRYFIPLVSCLAFILRRLVGIPRHVPEELFEYCSSWHYSLRGHSRKQARGGNAKTCVLTKPRRLPCDRYDNASENSTRKPNREKGKPKYTKGIYNNDLWTSPEIRNRNILVSRSSDTEIRHV